MVSMLSWNSVDDDDENYDCGDDGDDVILDHRSISRD